MPNTATAGVYYPDENTTGEAQVWAAAMASSIENGIGKRLTLQEIAVGLKASVAGWTIPKGNSATTVIPYTVNTTLANFNQGFTFTNGVAEVLTPGMYLVTASLGPQGFSATGGCKVALTKNGTPYASSEVPFSNSVWVNSQATSVISCVAGDRLAAIGTLSGPPPGTYPSEGATTYISIAMVQAVPVP